MQQDRVVSLTQYLGRLYGERFPEMTPDMLALWCEALASTTAQECARAVRLYAAQHHATYAPRLQDLLNMIELIRNDDEEQADLERRLQARAAVQKDYVQTLAEAAERGPEGGTPWGRCHVQMVLRGLGRDDNHEETAQQCEVYAAQYPDDAWYWHQEAAWWRSGGQGRPYFGSQRPSGYATMAGYESGYIRDPGEDDA